MKKFISILLVVCTVAALCTAVFAASNEPPAERKTVGYEFDAGSDPYPLNMNMSADDTHVKIWVRCETGVMDVWVEDENGEIVGAKYTLDSATSDDSHIYRIIRDSSYTGDYMLWVRGHNGYSATGVYNCLGGTSFISDVPDTVDAGS